MTKNCIICGNKYLTERKAYFIPFLIDRMFEGKNVITNLVYCKSCNFYYSSYRPTEEQMKKLYRGYRNKSFQQQRYKFENWYTEEFNYSLGHNINEVNSRKQKLYDILKNNIDITKIKNILDFGGDEGQFIPDQLINANKYVYEISDINTVNGVKKISNETELSKHQYDLIMCCHVLEHVSCPMDIVSKLVSLMKKGNYLYMEVPYDDYWVPQTAKGFIKDRNSLQSIYIHEHINMFRKQTFKRIFEKKMFNFNLIYFQVVKDKNILGINKIIKCLVQK